MEMLGTSAYDYCHLSDLENLTDCHKKSNLKRKYFLNLISILYSKIILKSYHEQKSNKSVL